MQLIDILNALQRDKTRMPTEEEALPGRAEPVLADDARHFVLGVPLHGPYPEGSRLLHVGMGCFWGAEKAYWALDGVHVTAVGYGGGHTPNPTYEEVCSGRTGHNELVRIVYDPAVVELPALLRVFWEGHDPTQEMRQGNDVGTQYRSGLYLSAADDQATAEASREAYAARLCESGHTAAITTEIVHLDPAGFYFAEAYHQQYLAAHPGGYCGLGGLGVPLERR